MLNAVSKEARIILLKQSSNNYLALEVCGTTIAYTASLCVFLGYRLKDKSQKWYALVRSTMIVKL